MQSIEETARTVDEAINQALRKLQVKREDVEVAILEVTNRSRLFGFLGQPSATVRVTVKKQKEKEVPKVSAPSTAETEPVKEEPPLAEEPPPVVETEETGKESSAVNNLPEAAEQAEEAEPETASPAETVTTPSEFAHRACTFIGEVLLKMGMDATPEFRGEDERNVYVELVGNDLGILIGKHGMHLNALQYLVNVILTKDRGVRKKVILDGGGYRARRHQALVELAKSTAMKVKRKGTSIRLGHLRADERRVIHLALQDDPRVRTFSEGEEPNRTIVIAPAGKNEPK